MDIDFVADGNFRELSGEEAWEAIENFAQGQKEWDNPPNIIPEQELANLKAQAKRLFGNKNVSVEMHRVSAAERILLLMKFQRCNQSSNPSASTNPNPKGRNRRRSKKRIEKFNLDDLSSPVVTMADQRTVAQLFQAPTEGYEDAIVVPAITADNFELKHGFLTLVQNKQFFRHDKEDPHAHVHYFNNNTSTLKFPSVPNTSIKLMLFPFSLKELHQLDTFYNDLNSKDQDSLNSAAGGNFLDKMPRECLGIIESKSKVRYSRHKPVVAKVSTTASTSGVSPDVAELKDMVRALPLDKKGQSPAPMKVVEESCVTCGVNFNQGNTGYRPPMMSNQIRPPGFPPVPNNQNLQRNNQNRFIPNQNRGNNFNQRPVYQPPVFQTPAYQAPAYQAPAPQTQGVSKEDFSAYVIANDAVMRNMQTQGQNMQNQLTNLTDLITKFVNSNTASTLSSGTLPSNTIAHWISDLKAITTRSEVTKDTVDPINNENTKDVQPQAVQFESPILISKPITSLISEPAISPIFKDMSFEISFVDALILMPKLASTLKALIGNKEKLSEMAQTPLNEHCFAVLLKKLPKKLGDPGKFLIPCDFPGMAECLALADLGASINLMPFSVWKKLSLPDLTPTCMTLELADRSISRPVGVAEDVYVKEVLGFSDIISSGIPTPFYDPMVSATSPTLTPFGNSDFHLEEVDAFLAVEDEPTSSEFYQPYLDPEGDILILEAFLNDDPSLPPPNQRNYLPEVRKELKICEAYSKKSPTSEKGESQNPRCDQARGDQTPRSWINLPHL
nr:hypothetical protein [Tanacetum cinerariifolium]